MKNKVLVVGAGFAGSIHARELAENGYNVTLIDKRDHIAGNCYDFIDSETSVRIHRYGPHLFHTSNGTVFEYLSKFTKWTKYEHRVVVKINKNKLVPLPININTINDIFNQTFKNEEDVRAFLDKLIIRKKNIMNAEDWLYSKIGKELTDIFYRPYTKKMWGLDLKEVSHAIVKRIKFSFSNEDRYFPNDTIQYLPTNGYTCLFENLLDHENIDIKLSQNFDKSMINEFDFCFNSMPIDEYYDFRYGHLPYRSIKFVHSTETRDSSNGHVVINYSDQSRYTRETWWHNLPKHADKNNSLYIKTKEIPCDYSENNLERYYPVKTHDDRYGKTYNKYKNIDKNQIQFIGRCGTYQYLDMHQVVNQSLINIKKWIKSNE